jgi:hypothetical protein
MNIQDIADIVIGLGLVCFIAYRQMTWRYVNPSNVWRMPIVLGLIGVITLANSGGRVTPTDVVFLGIEALVSIGVGLTMGRLTIFRVAPTPSPKGDTMQSRTRGWGAALWIVLILVRVGLDVLGAHLGAELITSTGTILLMLALNRAARAVVLDQRLPRGNRVRA